MIAVTNSFPDTAVAPISAEPSQAGTLTWDLLLACVAGYILTAVGRVHQLFPALEVLHPAILTGLFGILLYLLDQSEERKAHDLWIAPTKYLLALLVWIALSAPGALVMGNSFELFIDFIKTVLMYFIVVGAVRGTRDVERLAAVYLLAAVVYAAVVLSRFDLGDGDAWRLGRLYYYDANDFATFAVTALPFALFFLHAGRRMVARVLAGVGMAVLTLAFVYTGSRGGFLALVTVAAFIVLRYKGIALGWRLSATALVTVVVLATASDQYWHQMGTITSDSDYNRTAETGRMQIWQRGIGYMLDNPVFGVGPNNFQTAEGTLSPFADRQQFGVGVRWNAAHNSFIQIGAELGIPGLVMLVGLIVSTFFLLRRLSLAAASPTPDSQRQRALTQALMAALIGFVVGAFFLSFAYSDMLYTLVALAVGLHKVTV